LTENAVIERYVAIAERYHDDHDDLLRQAVGW
jgi:hypothetical protein